MTTLDAKAVANHARGAISELHRRIDDGDKNAANELVQLLRGGVESLTYSPDPKGVLIAIARKQSWWPVLTFAREKDGEAYMRSIANKFQLGEECGLKLRGKKAELGTPETNVAWHLYDNIEMDRKRGLKLPPLSRKKEVIAAWWKECERVLPLIFGEEFEKHAVFSHWQLKVRVTKKIVRNKAKEVKEPWNRWEIRKEIKKKLRQSLVSLAS